MPGVDQWCMLWGCWCIKPGILFWVDRIAKFKLCLWISVARDLREVDRVSLCLFCAIVLGYRLEHDAGKNGLASSLRYYLMGGEKSKD